jgi:hypothetical protein
VKDGHGPERDREVASAPAMVAQHAPVLEAGDGVLDPGAAAAMAFPGTIAADPVALEDGCYELWDAPVAAVSQDPRVRLAQGCEVRTALNPG